MRISHSSYQKYIEQLSKEIKGEKLFSPVLLNNKTIVFPFMEKKGETLFISLNPKCPILFKARNDMFFSSFENPFLDRFRKYIGKSEIRNISLSKEDLIIQLDLFSLDNLDEYSLIIELIPNCPNLFVIDKDNLLKDHYFKFKNRELKTNEPFVPLINEKLIDGEIRVDEKLFAKRTAEEYEIRSKEKYASFRKWMMSKLNGVSRKLEAIEKDIEKAKEYGKYQGIADDILSSGLDLKAHQDKFEGVKLDPAKSLLENAQSFYKKAKKGRETIKRAALNQDNAAKEQAELRKICDEFLAGDERKRDEIVATYMMVGKKKETKPTIVNRPWKVNLNGTIIYFGRNASQNDYLSFVMKLDREFTWLHIKDKSGAHLVIANKKPTENELLTACEIALLCSRVSAGEVTYTKKKNVRRGHTLGEALLKNYSNIKLNNVRKETIALLESAIRLD